MALLKVYKETDITNKEMIDVLQKLSLVEVVGDPYDYRMESKTFDMYLLMPRRPLNEFILKGYTVKFSNMLVDFGVTEDSDDLVKMVLKERTKRRREEKKQMAVMV